MRKFTYFLLLIALLILPAGIHAAETYAGSEVVVPEGWQMTQMQTFSGAAPSRAWVFEKGGQEMLVAIFVTEGIAGGMQNQDFGRISELYLRSAISGWGGEPQEGTQSAEAEYCGGYAGAEMGAEFGTESYVYRGCFIKDEDGSRAAAITTWSKGTALPPEAAAALKAFAVSLRLHQAD